jgi:hypothetical protein
MKMHRFLPQVGGGSGGVFVMVGNWHAQSPSRQVVNAKEVFL